MKKFLLSILFLINICFAYAQRFDTYSSIDNNKFSIGDTIVVGYNSGNQYYRDIKDYYYNSTYDQGYRNIKVNIFSKSLKIVNIYKDTKSIFDTSAVVIEAKLIGSIVTKYFIDINKALSSGELMLLINQYWKENKGIRLFSDTTAFLFKFKQATNPKSFLDEYLCKFKTTIYEKYRNDEFELDNQKQIAFVEINKKISKLNDSIVYYVDIELKTENYDFDLSSFPIKGFEEYIRFDNIHSLCTVFNSTGLFLINKENVEYLKVDKKIANGFVKRRKNWKGDVDRTIYARLYINNVNFNKDSFDYHFFKDSYNMDFIFGSIHYIDFYEFNNRVYNYLGRTKLK